MEKRGNRDDVAALTLRDARDVSQRGACRSAAALAKPKVI